MLALYVEEGEAPAVPSGLHRARSAVDSKKAVNAVDRLVTFDHARLRRKSVSHTWTVAPIVHSLHLRSTLRAVLEPTIASKISGTAVILVAHNRNPQLYTPSLYPCLSLFISPSMSSSLCLSRISRSYRRADRLLR